jgi:predicted AAA+ superfamily ATPase
MIPRDAQAELLLLASQFKAVAITGPRQSGKTTLVRAVFPERPYVSLENPDTRNFALQDPRGFLTQFASGAIIDEAQRAPELFSYLQQVLDESNEKGRFILTGSNNFLLQESISQSLAGRIAYLHLLPFTLNELPTETVTELDAQMLRGGYPPLYDGNPDPSRWFANYIRTYIERDVRQIKNITDLTSFERFVRLCAGRTGQLLNMNSLALETGVDSKTISSWIGVLESSFIVFLLRPHHRNYNKRLVKMPKLYFYDTGLACALLGISDASTIALHPLRGSLFENLVVSELLKWRLHHGKQGGMYFWRNSIGNEIDLLVEGNNRTFPIEIKSGQTVQPAFFKGLDYWQKLSGQVGGAVIHGGETLQVRSNGISTIPWKNMNTVLE